jgi:hypothetical protein
MYRPSGIFGYAKAPQTLVVLSYYHCTQHVGSVGLRGQIKFEASVGSDKVDPTILGSKDLVELEESGLDRNVPSKIFWVSP